MEDKEWSDFIVYNDNLKNATINTSSNKKPVKNKDGFMRWHDQTLTIFSSEINDSQEEIIKNNELQESDKIVWVKDLPKDILAEYQDQIKEMSTENMLTRPMLDRLKQLD
jgi:hypothetical protein